MASRSSRLLPALRTTRRQALLNTTRCAAQLPVTAAPLRCLSTTVSRSAAEKASGLKQIKLTSDSYPDVKRDARFGQVTPEHVTFFKDLLGPSGVIDGVTADATEDLQAFNEDWMRKYRGQSKLLLKPASTEESSTTFSGVVVDACVISRTRQSSREGYIFPLDLGAKGSCHIGGNVATNAGGLRLLRYGSLHGNVLGLEAVLPDGTVVEDLCTLRKNNTGYDLKQLFIGGEGTVGIITKVSVICPQRSSAVNVAFFGLESFDKVQQAFKAAKGQLSEILSAFELMDAGSQQLVHQVRRDAKRAPRGRAPVLLPRRDERVQRDHDYEKLEKFLEDVMSNEVVSDGVLAQDETQAKALWSWREGIPECLGHWGGTYKYDVSIPIADMYKLVEDTNERMQAAGLVGDTDAFPVVGVVGYGHMGDSNLHLNAAVRRYDPRVEEVLEPFVYEWIQKRNGSISAEHGLGVAKKKFIGYSRSDSMIGLMKGIKNLYDPNGIMNPYKYI
ncbi:D-lactate dehydrogenase [Verticillium alfalfae VaMs.102]|uniref:D-lactate dehydrogenase n=1 Tax=Verticillium alfalfae (strain VaMs.102 / ATCC MYA-4576 / FGSC 10136) TaxID=526221 RepID=C9SCA4_VERA1|nr:D-lactate dehydrogenase [Verticillium alfalfae VaMs.102]EEY16719.1 D-lactate dehydrogenase [Verticillium alfalfae VaMs.102]